MRWRVSYEVHTEEDGWVEDAFVTDSAEHAERWRRREDDDEVRGVLVDRMEDRT